MWRLPGIGLEEFEHIGIDANWQDQVDRPGPQVQEPAQQVQGPQPMSLRQKNLKRSVPYLMYKWWITLSTKIFLFG